MNKIITIHQPNYLPWLGFFHKIVLSDIFVILDDVQFEKNSFNNRNRIKTSQGSCWLTVPVITKNKSKELINNIEIDNKQDWSKKHLKTIKLNYSKTRYYHKYIPFFEKIYAQEWKKLSDLSLFIIKWVLDELQIETPLILSSTLNNKGKKSELIKEICLKLESNLYVSGKLGKDYLELEPFEKEGLKIYFQDYHHPKYDQPGGDFIPYLSVIDLMFNCGPESKNIIMQGNINKEQLINKIVPM